MEFRELLFSEGGKRIYLVGRAATVVIGLVAGSLSLAIGAHNYLRNVADRGPAILLKSAELQKGWPGQAVRIKIEFDKLRPCLPKSATLQIPGADGTLHPAPVSWVSPFPVKKNIKAVLIYTIPETLVKGTTGPARLEVFHHECTDGVDPELPATIETPPLEVK